MIMRDFDKPSPLTQLQAETAEKLNLGLPRLSATRRDLDHALVVAFDLGVKALRDLDEEANRSLPDRPAKYVVSLIPDRVQPYDEDDLMGYDTPEEAGEAILNNVHGEAGRRYVLRVETSVEAMYDRAWALVRKDQ
jgi:hypothetical protein